MTDVAGVSDPTFSWSLLGARSASQVELQAAPRLASGFGAHRVTQAVTRYPGGRRTLRQDAHSPRKCFRVQTPHVKKEVASFDA